MLNENSGQDVFERTLLGTLAYEITPVEGRCMYNAETFIASLAGELAPLEEDRLVAHLIICPACAKEYASLEKSLQQETERLTSEVLTPTLVAQMQHKRKNTLGTWRYLEQMARSLLMGKGSRMQGAIRVVVAGLIVALSIVLPLHYLSGGSPAIIPADGQMVAKGDSLVGKSDSLSAGLTPASLVEKVDSMAGYESWRAMAFIIGYLRAAGVPLGSASLAFDHQTTYTTGSGDTWRIVAEKALGDGDLWPIVILLNHNRTQHGEFPPVGTILRVPASAKGSK